MPLLIVILGILLLFVLIAKFKLNAFISFIIVCVFVGVFQGMELDRIVEAIQIGMGNTLGFLVMILGLGAMLGKLVSDSGAAQRITSKLVSSFGIKYIQWAVVVAGFIVGIPMFYSVGFAQTKGYKQEGSKCEALIYFCMFLASMLSVACGTKTKRSFRINLLVTRQTP